MIYFKMRKNFKQKPIECNENALLHKICFVKTKIFAVLLLLSNVHKQDVFLHRDSERRSRTSAASY